MDLLEAHKSQGNNNFPQLIALYETLIKQRNHYYLIAWISGAILVPLSLYILKFAALDIRRAPEYTVPVGVTAIILLFMWNFMFDRLAKSAHLIKDSINEIEKEFTFKVKPIHHYSRNINSIKRFRDFIGFSDIASFWAMRWIFFSYYIFCWIMLWSVKIGSKSFDPLFFIFYSVFPLLILLGLNIQDLKKHVDTRTNYRLEMVLFTILWFVFGLIYINYSYISVLLKSFVTVPTLWNIHIYR
jgi:hypothetical protein